MKQANDKEGNIHPVLIGRLRLYNNEQANDKEDNILPVRRKVEIVQTLNKPMIKRVTYTLCVGRLRLYNNETGQ